MERSTHQSAAGIVYLVGAGPGDPGLITRAGMEAIAGADAVIYDRLACDELLSLARDAAECVYVGKAASLHSWTQEAINQLLVTYASQGKSVCRLKGGDPFVFGRGGEEAAYLHEHAIPFVIIPGVSSATAVPAYAGIPVTDRSCASSFAVITGHEDPRKATTSLDWQGITHGADTLVFLMGLANLPHIVRELCNAGKDETTPVAAIQQGTTVHQRVVIGTLQDIVHRVDEAQLSPPTIIVVGQVVALRNQLAWFETRPLFGKRILVTRAREQASVLANMLRMAGAEPVEFPTIRIMPLPPTADLLTRLQQADWLVFTSANGLPSLMSQIEQCGGDVRSLGNGQIAAIGPATAMSIRQYGLHVDFMPSQFIAETVAAEFPDPMGKQVAIIRAESAREALPFLLQARGAHIDTIPAYRTVTDVADTFDLSTVDAVTFTSSSTVQHFLAHVSVDACRHPVIACIGPITAQTAREMDLRVDIQAEEYTISGLVKALEDYFSRNTASEGT
ncbi:MAG TPA: uroporphyrinogen-III C-methyltransferase [Armatimonadota bacterium]|nr:uroporphyrinogen-III C-methyltransferase [Armatimonadota bacterium]